MINQDPGLARVGALPAGPLHHDLDRIIGDERLCSNHMIKRGCGQPAQPRRRAAEGFKAVTWLDGGGRVDGGTGLNDVVDAAAGGCDAVVGQQASV